MDETEPEGPEPIVGAGGRTACSTASSASSRAPVATSGAGFENAGTWSAVPRMMLRVCATVSVGFRAIMSAATPDTCGAAIEVPSRRW